MSDLKKRVAEFEHLRAECPSNDWYVEDRDDCRVYELKTSHGIAKPTHPNAAYRRVLANFIAYAANEALALVRDLAAEVERLEAALAPYTTHDHEPCMYCDPLRTQIATLKAEVERLSPFAGEAMAMSEEIASLESRLRTTAEERDAMKQRVADLEMQLAKERADYKQIVNDTFEGMECLPQCDSYGHHELCPDTNAAVAFRLLRDRVDALQSRLEDTVEAPCTCGSGAHPRRCEKHPQGYALHVMSLNYDNACEELKDALERLEAAEKALHGIIGALDPEAGHPHIVHHDALKASPDDPCTLCGVTRAEHDRKAGGDGVVRA